MNCIFYTSQITGFGSGYSSFDNGKTAPGPGISASRIPNSFASFSKPFPLLACLLDNLSAVHSSRRFAILAKRLFKSFASVPLEGVRGESAVVHEHQAVVRTTPPKIPIPDSNQSSS